MVVGWLRNRQVVAQTVPLPRNRRTVTPGVLPPLLSPAPTAVPCSGLRWRSVERGGLSHPVRKPEGTRIGWP